ncbi:MAG TPA: hypothetical protein VK652_10265 [Steroidobacteraceae bacterium]|nr:hypothetical protein [Steroidobacteraceae bacterium]
MRCCKIFLLLALLPHASHAGALADKFAQGFADVAWGTSLAKVVNLHPEGFHVFAVGPGERLYEMQNEQPLFGIARDRKVLAYGFDPATGGMREIQIYFPYEFREKLLGTLTLSFGPYTKMEAKGISTMYYWLDNGTFLELRATLDPAFGILDLVVSIPRSAQKLPTKQPGQTTN